MGASQETASLRGAPMKAGVNSLLGAHEWIAGALLIGGGLVHQHIAKKETRLAHGVSAPAGAAVAIAPFAAISDALGGRGHE